MLKFTFDTNCIIAVEENRPEAEDIRKLADAHSRASIDVSLVAMSASEKQRDAGYTDDFRIFQSKIKTLSLEHLGLVFPMCYLGISFLGACLLGDEQMTKDEFEIHRILFPNLEFSYDTFCNARGLEPTSAFLGERVKWRNAKCDVQALWSHLHAKRDVFVTSDNNFHKASRKPVLLALGAGRIERPKTAVALLP